MLENFARIWKPRSKIDDGLVDIYQKALKGYTDAQIYTAADIIMNTNKFWPKPAEIRAELPHERDSDEREDFRIFEGRCMCGHQGLVIEEPKWSKMYRCRECYSGLSSNEYKQRIQDLGRMMEDKSYRPEWVKEVRDTI